MPSFTKQEEKILIVYWRVAMISPMNLQPAAGLLPLDFTFKVSPSRVTSGKADQALPG